MNSLQSVIVAISVAYALLGALLLAILTFARLDWRLKGGAVVLTSAFYIVSFAAARNLLGWASPEALPRYFKLLQARVVEPYSTPDDPGSVYLWVEALGDDNRPIAAPRAYRLAYTPHLADRTAKATSEIEAGRPVGGLSSTYGNGEGGVAEPTAPGQFAPVDTAGGDPSSGAGAVPASANADGGVAFTPLLPPKLPPKDAND